MDIQKRQDIEIQFWKNSPSENPESDSPHNIVNKMGEAGVFLQCYEQYKDLFQKSGTILELGGGQGWSSCLIKKMQPQKQVYLSDISEYAVASAGKWERIFQTTIEKRFACRSYEIPLPDASVDLIYAFAAAHHFAMHRKTLSDILRVLKSGGSCVYLNEPVCPKILHRICFWRVNRKRPEVPEDVIVTRKLVGIAKELGLKVRVDYFPTMKNRGSIESLYFFVLGRFRLLNFFLPSTANFVFTKP
jgi:SAM-dependent methyltransferase